MATVYKSKVEIVYEDILDKIATGQYKHGDRLIISQVARDNNVSDIPVREAIRTLEKEGYLHVQANQGAVVSSPTKESLEEIFEMRAVLEGYAARSSIDYLTKKDFADLRQCNKKLDEALKAQNINRYSQLNMDFHLRIYRVLPHKMMYNMITDLWKKYSITKSVFSLVQGRAATSVEEHELLLQKMEAKDYDGVELMMRQHKMQAGLALCEQIDQREAAQLPRPSKQTKTG